MDGLIAAQARRFRDQLQGRSTRQRLIASVGPYAGLGNRIRTILSAEGLAESEDREFMYSWPTGRRFGAKLTDLWRYDAPTVNPIVVRALSTRYPIRNADVAWRDEARPESLWLIRSGQPMALPATVSSWTDRLRSLRPTDEITTKVTDFFDRRLRGTPYVGVMIRAHENSHELTRHHSPVGWFIDRMREVRAAVPDICFYVSCDVPSVQQQIVDSFDNACGLAGKDGYNSRPSLVAAVSDLYLLGSSAHILAPHYSSFPELALYLTGGRIALETSVSPAPFPDASLLRSLVADPTRPDVRASIA